MQAIQKDQLVKSLKFISVVVVFMFYQMYYGLEWTVKWNNSCYFLVLYRVFCISFWTQMYCYRI
jgi:hypothetical protein